MESRTRKLARNTLQQYILITPARNEEAFIEQTIRSVVAQSVLPMRWVIVDDGSTDRTAEIVESYEKRYPWVELIRRSRRLDRSFAGKVRAFNAGLERLRSLQFEVIGKSKVLIHDSKNERQSDGPPYYTLSAGDRPLRA